MRKSKSKGTKFAAVKKMINKKTTKKPQVSSALFFSYNMALGPPYRIIVDTNFINFSIQNMVVFKNPCLPLLAEVPTGVGKETATAAREAASVFVGDAPVATMAMPTPSWSCKLEGDGCCMLRPWSSRAGTSITACWNQRHFLLHPLTAKLRPETNGGSYLLQLSSAFATTGEEICYIQ